MIMQDILSAPSPSLVARLEGQILSIISSTILDTLTEGVVVEAVPGLLVLPFVEAWLKVPPRPVDFYAGVDPVFCNVSPVFLVGDAILLRPAATVV